jgi:hypothetical protein
MESFASSRRSNGSSIQRLHLRGKPSRNHLNITNSVHIFFGFLIFIFIFYIVNNFLGIPKIKEYMESYEPLDNYSRCSASSLNRFPENWFDRGTYRSDNKIWTPNYVDINYQPSTSTNYFYRNGYFYPA